MVAERSFVELTEGEEYLHRDVWVVVNRQIEHANKDQRGSTYDYLVSMVFTFHALEGYLNFVGEKIAPRLWAEEKKLFGNSISAKIKKICNLCDIEVPDCGKRPYSTIKELVELRNKIAHPKIQKPKSNITFAEGAESLLFPRTYLQATVSRVKALRARDDVEQLIEELIHPAALMKFPDLKLSLGHKGLMGIMAMHTHHTVLAEGRTHPPEYLGDK